MEIVKPSVEDCKSINNLAVQVHNCHVQWRPDFYTNCDEIISKDDLKDMIDNNSIFVAKKDDKIVGYVSLIVKEREHKGFRYRKQMDVDAICVDEKYRRQGIATELLDYVKKYALELDCTDIFLNVNPQNDIGIHLYEKFGMTVRNIGYSIQIK